MSKYAISCQCGRSRDVSALEFDRFTANPSSFPACTHGRGATTDLPAVLRDVATTHLASCATCTTAILPGEAVSWKGQVLCPACALEEAAAIAVHALSVYAPDPDLATLERAAEVLAMTAGTFRATVDAMRRRAERGTP